MKITVSVIIAAYNEERYIARCLESLLEQTHSPLEILVVDDGSTDSTYEIVSSFDVLSFQRNHAGPASCRNLAARQARGDVLIIADADMTYDPGYIERLVAPLMDPVNPEVATNTHDEYVQNWANRWARCENHFANLPERRRLPETLPLRSSVFRAIRREFFLSNGGFTEGLGRSDDKSLFERTGRTAAVVEGAICYHNNAESIGAVVRDASWIGKDFVVRKESRAAILFEVLWFNPAYAIVKGVIRAATRRESTMLVYAPLYWFGYTYGIVQAVLFRNFLK